MAETTREQRVVVRDASGFDWVLSPEIPAHEYARRLTAAWPKDGPYTVIEITTEVTTTITERVIAPEGDQ